ncbi:membrane protein [Rhodococcoides trifolii]|uniref:Membrane protein n=1 Tax=Rhodococcoides trifolii TaxID=908250 RepID=A0A917D5P2_9NOCA|nr:TIGR02234 family membrane protein [Rhodococcus trifolii]GGG11739.1 membrane protein [Rhodococcus trifolii]
MSRTSARRATALTALLLVIAALCLWAASRMTWVTVSSVDGLGEERTSALDGGTWAAATTPLALALVAAVAAMFAVRGRWSILIGLLVAAVSIGALVPAVSLLFGGADADRGASLAELPARAEVTTLDVSRVPAAVVVVGAVCALVAAVLLCRTPPSHGGLSSKYDAPAVRRAEAERAVEAADDTNDEPSERALWDALDSGLDPTDDRRPPR